VALADYPGASVQTVQYDPYGQPTLSGTATGNPLLFQGQRYDAESGLYYFRNRYYSPVLGRFMQRDPMGYMDGMDLYTSFRVSPCVFLDPKGGNCTVFYKCTLTSSKDDGHCTTDCVYDCREIRRTDSLGGAVLCSDLPDQKLFMEDLVSNTDFCCWITNGLLGGPPACKASYDTYRIVGDWGILEDLTKCSRSKCLSGCTLFEKGCIKGCELVKNKAEEYVCKRACEVAFMTCRDACNVICRDP